MNTTQKAATSGRLKSGVEMIYNNTPVWIEHDPETGMVNVCDSKQRGLNDNYFVVPKSDLQPVGKARAGIVAKAAEPIKKVSDKMAKLLRAYNVLAVQFKKNNSICKATVECSGSPTTEVHHRKGRGPYMLDESTWLPVCSACHSWIEQHPKLSKEYGLSEDRI